MPRGPASGTIPPGGESHGRARRIDASEEEPQYKVRSEKSGTAAAHTPGALRKKRSRALRKKR
ncbi:DUF2945 domain-containing protein [Streptomyces endophytica]|uniref:DUF2945 domain-containing protein n=1 Tax=Streptomyces endophytica TaxID=2991496 RepID=A0ABY6PIK3_9ACTN|nr:DUF2945 domain-containing protein [Streptomyces endophytica]UZJ32992.1 DUF2945 domain-containing protein [Streptomyces endophytica]